jgi:hypothetical protein
MRNSQRYMRRCLRERRFSFFWDTAIRAACLCSPLGARSTRRVRIRSVGLLLALRELDAGTDDAPLRWSTADDRALEEAVARARMGLLFVGVKSS